MAITTQQIKELRERTLVGLADCKNALTEADGDMELAIDILRKKGIAKAAKRADNATAEGRIMIESDGKTAYAVSVSCETDFVSRNDVFGGMLSDFITILKNSASSAEALEKAEASKSDFVLKIGENLKINALEKYSGDVIEFYVHSNGKVASLVVAKEGTDREKLKQVAMHITATNPEVLSPTDIGEDLIAKEKEIALAQMKDDPKNAGKSEEILAKIIDGKMTKFREENALLTQPFVVNPDVKVGEFIGKDAIVSFKRFAI